MIGRWVDRLPLLALLPVVHTLVITSKHRAQLAFDSAYDHEGSRVLTTGIYFRSALRDYTLYGPAYTDCFIEEGVERALYQTPQLCTHFEIFPEGKKSELPAVVSLGMDGDQASIASIPSLTEDRKDWQLQNIMELPSRQFPVAVATDVSGGVYVGMHSTGGKVLPIEPSGVDKQLSNINGYYELMTRPGPMTRAGSPIIVRMDMIKRRQSWRMKLNTTDGHSAIGGIVHLPHKDLIVIAGSTNGHGMLVGAGATSSSWDGFITILNATSGEADREKASMPSYSTQSLKINSQIGQTDYALGICAHDDEVYVVGTTTGQMTPTATSGGAFIQAYDVDTLNIKWTHQWSGDGVEALKCLVTSRKEIYIAGHVPSEVVVDDERRSSSSYTQDIFVSLLDGSDGTVRWTRQIDSRRHDTVAKIMLNRASTNANLIITHNAMDLVWGVNEIVTSTIAKDDGFHDWQELPDSVDPLGGLIPGPIDMPAPPLFRHWKAVVVIMVAFLIGVVAMVYIRRSQKSVHEGFDPNAGMDTSSGLELREITESEATEDFMVNGGVVA